MQNSQLDIDYYKKKGEYLEVINRFATVLLNAKTIDDVVWSVAKNAIAQLGYVDCVVYLLDDQNEYLIQRAAHGPKNPIDLDILNPIKIKIGVGIVGTVAEKCIGEIVTDTTKDKRYILDDNMGLSEIAVPIIYQNKIIGVIDSEHPEKNYYTQDDLEILTTIASMTATKLVQGQDNEKIQIYQNNLESLVEEKTTELNNALIELKAQTLELKDSINYAKRIQKAILRNPDSVKEIWPDSFLLYKPKDSIGGDFYLMEQINDKIVIAVADCTGHGVPGAIISVICDNAIKRAIRNVGLSDPAKILDQTRDFVIETFMGSGEDIKDGMDIALCILDPITLQVSYSGANISLHYIKQSELIEIKSDKQPVGNHLIKNPFTSHTIQLSKNDSIFLFTDGMPDQFGGPKGKKFKYKQLRELIHSSQQLSMLKLGELVDKTFDDWKANITQVDDVSILGIRV